MGGVRGDGSPPATNDFPLADGRRMWGLRGDGSPPRPMMIQKRPKGEALEASPPANGRPAGGVQGGQRPPAQHYFIIIIIIIISIIIIIIIINNNHY